MAAAVALPLFLLGLCTLLGTAATLLVEPGTSRDTVPRCCRRRVDAFAARARFTLSAAAVVTGVGVALLVAGLP